MILDIRSKIKLSEEQKNYLENLERAKKTTTNEFTLKLINAFYEDLNSKEFEFTRFLDCIENHVYSKDFYRLDEVFPEDLYPTLDIFIGKDGRVDFLEIIENIRKTPYDSRFRSKNYKLYANKIAEIFEAFINKEFRKLSTFDLFKNPNGELVRAGLALEIDRGNQEIINFAEEMILEDDTYIGLSKFDVEEIFKSNNKHLVKLLGNKILYESFKEKFREIICERIHTGTIENFKYMYELIYENDFVRYHSVEMYLNLILGLSKYNNNRKNMKIIYNLFKGEQSAENLIKSDDVEEIYLGLWYTALFDIDSSLDKILKILEIDNENKVSMILDFLRLVEDSLKSEIVFKIITENFNDEEIIDKIDIFVRFLKLVEPKLRNRIAYKIILKNPNNYHVVSSLCDCAFYFTDRDVYKFSEKDSKNKSIILKNYFGNREIANNIFEILHKLLDENFDESLFEVMVIISILDDNKEMLYKCLEYITPAREEFKRSILLNIFDNPKNDREFNFIIKMLTDGDVFYIAFRIAKEVNLQNKYVKEIESATKIANQAIREGLVELLYLRSDEEVFLSISNLISSKNKNSRIGALNLIIKSIGENRFPKEKLLSLAESIKKPTILEKDLLEEIFNNARDSVNHLYDVDYEYELELSEKDRKSIKDLKGTFSGRDEKLKEIIKKLNDFVEKYKNYQYVTRNGKVVLFGNDYLPLKHLLDNNPKFVYSRTTLEEYPNLEDYPLAYELRKFYEEEINDFSLLWQLNILRKNFKEKYYRYDKTDDVYKWGKKHYEWITNNLGIDIVHLKNLVDGQNRYTFNFRVCIVHEIIEVMFSTYEKNEPKFFLERLKFIGLKVLETFDFFDDYINWYLLFDTIIFDFDLSKFDMNLYKDDFRIIFTLKMLIEDKIKKVCDEKNHKGEIFKNFSDIEFAYACLFNIIKKDGYFKYLIYYKWLYKELDKIQNIVLNKISMFCNGIPITGRMDTERLFGLLNRLPQNVIEFIGENGQKAINYVVDMEILRGEESTEFSKLIREIERVQGSSFFVRIVKALEDNISKRDRYYFYGPSKKDCLYDLLKVSVPYENEEYETFEKEMRNQKISDEILVRAALYSKKWIPFISKYLGWDGFESGCYYFIAYTGFIGKEYMGSIAKYTPLSDEELELGILDVNWFKELYEKLGEERFELLYDNAKYISDGNRHARARLLSNGVNGNITRDDAENAITEKRNKDMLLTYGVIPLKGEEDLIHRYEFIQKFLEESKSFGAQRRTSEARTVKAALENLARNAGYEDSTRFIWSVECKLFEEIKGYFSPKNLNDTSVYIKISEEGKAEIVCEKGDKKLKSIPASIKKEPYILEMKDIVKDLKNQHSRSKKTLEDAMENQVIFFAKDLKKLLKHPIIYPLIKNLVFMKENNEKLELGFYREGNLMSYDGKNIPLNDDEKLRLAHCIDLYNSGNWSNYQKYLFDNKIQQPFKQIFRELYVKTEDEKNVYYSRRYDGHKIYIKKVIGALKNRKWVIDEEFEGLQKVYYKGNIIAKIYAPSDWIYPPDTESIAIEHVEFYDRKTFKEKRIDEIPDIIFSEVMRDVDLAISVSYVGQVDYETSQSIIEMRKAIAELTAKLFKLSNVSFEARFVKVKGVVANYIIHLGSGVIHQEAGAEISVLPVRSKHRDKIFLPFVDSDPKTSEILSKILLFSEDNKIKDPFILKQINRDNK